MSFLYRDLRIDGKEDELIPMRGRELRKGKNEGGIFYKEKYGYFRRYCGKNKLGNLRKVFL